MFTLINKDFLIFWRPGTQEATDDALEQLTVPTFSWIFILFLFLHEVTHWGGLVLESRLDLLLTLTQDTLLPLSAPSVFLSGEPYASAGQRAWAVGPARPLGTAASRLQLNFPSCSQGRGDDVSAPGGGRKFSPEPPAFPSPAGPCGNGRRATAAGPRLPKGS